MFSFQNVPECDEERKRNEEEDGVTEAGEEKETEDERSSDEGFMGMTPLLQAHHAMERMEEFVHKVKMFFTNSRVKWDGSMFYKSVHAI